MNTRSRPLVWSCRLWALGVAGSGCLQPSSAPALDADALGTAASAVWFVDSPQGTWIESLPAEQLAQNRSQTLTDEVEPELWLYNCPVDELLSPRRVLTPPLADPISCREGGAPCPERAFRLTRPEPEWIELPTEPTPRPWPVARPSPCSSVSTPRVVALEGLDQEKGTVAFLTPIGDHHLLVGAYDFPGRGIRGHLWVWEVPEATNTSWQPELQPPVLSSTTAYLAGAPLGDGRVALWGDVGVTAIAELREGGLVITPGPQYPVEAQRCPRTCLVNECEDRCLVAPEPACVVTCLADPFGCIEHSRMAQVSVAGPATRPTWWAATACRNLLKGDGQGPFEVVRRRDDLEAKTNLPFDVLAVGPEEAYAAGILERGVLHYDNGELVPQPTEEMPLPTTALMALDSELYTTVRVELVGAFLYRRNGRSWQRALLLGTQEVTELSAVPGGFFAAVDPPGHLVQAQIKGLCRGTDFSPSLSASYRAHAMAQVRGHQLLLMELSQNSTELAKGLLAVFELRPPPACTALATPPLTPVEAGP